MEKKVHLFGKGYLYLNVVLGISILSCIVQMIGRFDSGKSTGGLFVGRVYYCNPIFFIAGLVLFVKLLKYSYDKILKTELERVSETNIYSRVFFFVIVILYTVLLFIGNVIVSILATPGLTDDIGPLYYICSVIGFPLANLLLIIYKFVMSSKSEKRNQS